MRVASWFALTAFIGTPAVAQTVAVPQVSALRDQRIDPVPMQRGVRLMRDLHLRLDAARGLVANPLDPSDTRLRHRFAGAMFDFYPSGNTGLHLSAGTRFYDVSNFAREAERSTNGLLYSPRMPAGAIGGMRTGFKRQTPAMTLGYNHVIEGSAVVGLEAGTLLGRVNASMPRAATASQRLRGDDGAAVNPVVNLVLGVKF